LVLTVSKNQAECDQFGSNDIKKSSRMWFKINLINLVLMISKIKPNVI